MEALADGAPGGCLRTRRLARDALLPPFVGGGVLLDMLGTTSAPERVARQTAGAWQRSARRPSRAEKNLATQPRAGQPLDSVSDHGEEIDAQFSGMRRRGLFPRCSEVSRQS
jgi:hypothetical protein